MPLSSDTLREVFHDGDDARKHWLRPGAGRLLSPGHVGRPKRKVRVVYRKSALDPARSKVLEHMQDRGFLTFKEVDR